MADRLLECITLIVVKRRCKRCEKTWGAWQGVGIVSPKGVEHTGGREGMTACGIDATGPYWWWPL